MTEVQVIEAAEGAVEWLRSVPIIGMRLEGKRNPDGRTERFLVPEDSQTGETIHIICEVTDSGTPTLSRYQRVIQADRE